MTSYASAASVELTQPPQGGPLPADAKQCDYSISYPPGSVEGTATLDVGLMPDPTGSVYQQLANALIEIDPDPGDEFQPTPPLGQECIETSNQDSFVELLVLMSNGYTLYLGQTSLTTPDLEGIARGIVNSLNGN